MGPWTHGTTGPWDDAWYNRTMTPWFHCSIGPCHHSANDAGMRVKTNSSATTVFKPAVSPSKGGSPCLPTAHGCRLMWQRLAANCGSRRSRPSTLPVEKLVSIDSHAVAKLFLKGRLPKEPGVFYREGYTGPRSGTVLRGPLLSLPVWRTGSHWSTGEHSTSSRVTSRINLAERVPGTTIQITQRLWQI